VASALVRRAREGAFSAEARDRALASISRDFAALIVVELTPHIASASQELLLRHQLRAGDAIQLASCLYLRREAGEPVELVAFDDRLIAAARDEGLPVATATTRARR
jgi:predicted nucleic acid-binding protein